MDYLGRLENSVTNFEEEISKLTKIGKLIQDTNTLIEEVTEEKELLKKSINQLENMQTQIKKNCDAIAEYTKNEESAQQKLVADIHKNFIDDSHAVIEKLSTPLENSRAKIDESCKLISQLIETHEKSQEKFLSNIELLLIKYDAKDIEGYNNIINAFENKIDVARDNIETNLNHQLNKFDRNISDLNGNLEQKISTLDTEFNKNIQEFNRKISSVSEEIEPLQEMLSTIRYIKIAVSLSLGTGLAACITCAINFLK